MIVPLVSTCCGGIGTSYRRVSQLLGRDEEAPAEASKMVMLMMSPTPIYACRLDAPLPTRAKCGVMFWVYALAAWITAGFKSTTTNRWLVGWVRVAVAPSWIAVRRDRPSIT